tara:strand:- start:751 stop:1191 length:441 start_codon:yes stop_codon:yes gene_type:complete
MMKKLLLIVVIILNSANLSKGQSKPDAEDWFYENYKEWQTHSDIEEYLNKNPELKVKLDDYYYSILADKYKDNKDFKKLAEEMELNLDQLEKIISEDSFRLIESIYWKIINSDTKDKIASVILKEMVRAKENLEREILKMPSHSKE